MSKLTDLRTKFTSLALYCYRSEDPRDFLDELEAAAVALEEELGLQEGWAEALYDLAELPS